MTKFRIVETNEQAVSLGFANIAFYRAAVRLENEREGRRQYAERAARHQAQLTAKLQPPGSGTTLTAGPIDALRRRSANLERGIWTPEQLGDGLEPPKEKR